MGGAVDKHGLGAGNPHRHVARGSKGADEDVFVVLLEEELFGIGRGVGNGDEAARGGLVDDGGLRNSGAALRLDADGGGLRAGHADIAGAVGLHRDRDLRITVVDGHLSRPGGHQSQRRRGPRGGRMQLQPAGIARRWPPGGGVLAVDGRGKRARRVRPAESRSIRGGRRRCDAAIVFYHLGQRAGGGIVAQAVAHRGGVARGQRRGDRAGERAVVAVAQGGCIGDDVRVGGDQLVGAGEERERFPAARHTRRIRRREIHGEVGVENHDVDFPQGVGLARNAGRRTRDKVVAHRDGPDAEALQH